MDITTPTVIRLRFTKTGPIRFISHLDLTRAFHRALSRAQIPIRFSEGFSPHPRFTFALPLSVGMESLCEVADFHLAFGADMSPEEIRERLKDQLPAGIEITSCALAEGKLSEIAFARYDVTLPKLSPALVPAVEAALQGELFIEKKNKKGKTVTKEISPGIHAFALAPDGAGVKLTLTLGAGGENVLGPDAVLQALAGAVPGFDKTGRRTVRLALLREDETEF